MGSMIAAGVVAFGLSAVFGLRAIDALRNLGAKQNISTDAPTRHAAKQGTPTMGGLLILAAFTVSCLLFAPTSGAGPIVLLTLAFGFIGFLDDYLSAKRGKNLGFRAREKFAAQCLARDCSRCGWRFTRSRDIPRALPSRPFSETDCRTS